MFSARGDLSLPIDPHHMDSMPNSMLVLHRLFFEVFPAQDRQEASLAPSSSQRLAKRARYTERSWLICSRNELLKRFLVAWNLSAKIFQASRCVEQRKEPPKAHLVLDRWHMLKNVRRIVQRMCEPERSRATDSPAIRRYWCNHKTTHILFEVLSHCSRRMAIARSTSADKRFQVHSMERRCW